LHRLFAVDEPVGWFQEQEPTTRIRPQAKTESILLSFIAIEPFSLFPSQGVSTMSLSFVERKIPFDDPARAFSLSKKTNNLIKLLFVHLVPFQASMGIVSYND
jgi:hypothetical protein